MALAAVAVLAEMVEAKSCPLLAPPSPAPAPAASAPPPPPPAEDAGSVPEGGV
jgi:hypothetical protein